MNKKVKSRDLLWGYAGYITEIAVYALLTPVLAVLLDSFTLGLWYTFMSIYSFLALIDGAFSPIITRNAAYCMAGAKELLREGVPDITDGAKANYGLMAALYKANRRLLAVISGAALVVLFAAGIPYISYITRSAPQPSYIAAWVIFSLGISCNLFVLSIPSFLKGTGFIATAQKAIAMGRALQLVICIGSVVLGFGIVGLSVGILCGALTIGILSWAAVKNNLKALFPQNTSYDTKNIIRAIWFNSKKLLLTTTGSYGVQQVNTLLCSTFIGLEMTASYGLTQQVFQAIGIISFVWMQTSVPAISAAKAQNDLEKQRKLFSVACIVQYSLAFIGSIAAIILVNPLLGLIGSQTLLLGMPYIAIFAFNAYLEKHISLYNNFLMCGNKVPYAAATVVAGVAVCILSSLSLYFTSLGILGLLLSQAIVQLSYNAWRWTRMACQELEISWFGLLAEGVGNVRNGIAGFLKKKA